jgi:hypothetical protein
MQENWGVGTEPASIKYKKTSRLDNQAKTQRD